MVAESSKTSLEKTSASEDLTDVMWSDPQWLASFPLNKNTAFQYFQLSQFYDTRCNNHFLLMQNMDMKLLKTMEGVEYSHSSPCAGLYIITKSFRRLRPTPSLETLAYYYIHEGRIFQAPTIYSILSTRLLQSFHHLRKSVDILKHSATLTSHGNYTWDGTNRHDDSPVAKEQHQDGYSEQGQQTAPTDEPIPLSSGEHKAVDDILYDIWQKNAAINEKQIEKAELLQQQQREQQQQVQQNAGNLALEPQAQLPPQPSPPAT